MKSGKQIINEFETDPLPFPIKKSLADRIDETILDAQIVAIIQQHNIIIAWLENHGHHDLVDALRQEFIVE